jgi:hypothetical protein
MLLRILRCRTCTRCMSLADQFLTIRGESQHGQFGENAGRGTGAGLGLTFFGFGNIVDLAALVSWAPFRVIISLWLCVRRPEFDRNEAHFTREGCGCGA